MIKASDKYGRHLTLLTHGALSLTPLNALTGCEQEKNKKKVMKASDKFKFNFDWDAGDDTSKDLNPLYNLTHRELHRHRARHWICVTKLSRLPACSWY